MSNQHYTIALAGNANVGKSVIFNQLTGLHQHIGNWPGKTVEKAEGTLNYKGYTIDFVDLPGIYSLSTFSMEELVSREYIATEKTYLSLCCSMPRFWSVTCFSRCASGTGYTASDCFEPDMIWPRKREINIDRQKARNYWCSQLFQRCVSAKVFPKIWTLHPLIEKRGNNALKPSNGWAA